MPVDPYNLIDKAKRYYAFSKIELRWLLVSILVMAFIVGFNDGRDKFELQFWLANFLIALIAVAIAVLAHETAHRVTGLEQGYKTTYKPFFYGLIAGLILSFMSYGKIIFLAYGGVFINIIEKHRVGYFRYQLGYFHLGAVSLMGPVANMVVAIFFKAVPILPQPLSDKIVLVNILFALTNMLPLPVLDGIQVLFASRWLYFLSYGAMIGITIFMLKGFTWWVVVLGSILAALIFWLGYYFVIEKKL
ncbi:hypothetical protein HYV82_06500 [Candidatus Woesearchaeota archaeon]|nr:hypothetical protein [Candidatus Woesearchaeota archaeon]